MRMVPIVSLAPFLGAKVAPIIARAGLAITLSVILLPFVITTSTHAIAFNVTFAGYALKELIIGLFFGFLVSIPFLMAQTSGSIIDFMRGSSFMMAQDITMQIQTSPIGQLYNYILIVLFFQLNGPFLFFDATLRSYELVPVDAFINPAFFEANVPFWKGCMDILNILFRIAIQVSAPAFLAILMAETFLGIANRLAPQVQIAFLGMPLKSFLGLLLLWAGWFFILKQLGNTAMDWLSTIDHMIQSITIAK
jgi:type III secretory pathway component EscT